MSVSEATHTPGPWTLEQTDEGIEVYGADDRIIGEVILDIVPEEQEIDHANARRIVACVNACKGISTESLEAGVVRELVEALERCEEIIDDLECECDSYHGFVCSIHADRELVRGVLAKARGEA